MIPYDTGKWGVGFAFQCRGSVFPKSMAIAVPMSLTCLALHFLLRKWDLHKGLNAGSDAANLLGSFQFVLGFLVVFRSQQGYSRWWEGGTLLQDLRGEWFNAFSCLIAFSSAKEEKRAEVAKFQHYLARLISLLYSSALKQVTTIDPPLFNVIELEGFDDDSLEFVFDCHDGCEVVLQWIQQLVCDADQKKIIEVAPPILSRVYNQLGNGIVNLSNARKIAKYPPPFPLAQMIAFMLFFSNSFTLFMCAVQIDKPLWAFAICFIVIISFQAVNYIALELEMPFGDDPNDLPLQEMQNDLNASLIQMMQPAAKTMPVYHFSEAKAKLMECNTDMDNRLKNYRRSLSIRTVSSEVIESVPEEKQQNMGAKESKSCSMVEAGQVSSTDKTQHEIHDVKMVIEQMFDGNSPSPPVVPVVATDAKSASLPQWTAITNSLETLIAALRNHSEQISGNPLQPNQMRREDVAPQSNTEILLARIHQELQCNQHQLADFHNDIIGALLGQVNPSKAPSEISQSPLFREVSSPVAGAERQNQQHQPSREFLS